ncbi:MAG: sigma-70 family RNA polymerase sigma factor [Gammaproteobacteria bacterium]
MSSEAVALDRGMDAWTLRLQSVARDRDRLAYGELFRHFAPLLKSFALSTPGMSSNALAEELVQEVMLKIWNRASTFDASKASATTWIYTLARNCRIDLLRRKYRVQEEVDVDDLWDVGTDPELLSDDLHQKRIEVDVRELLRALPPEQRQIIAKVYMEGKSHSEVAEELSLPLGTVKSRIRLAMSKLKVMLQR